MKKRTLIIALLLVAAMVLGVGYAALTREIVIKGGAEFAITEDKFAVNFVNVAPETTFSDGSAGQLTSWEASDKVAKFGLSKMEHAGESVTLMYKIQNTTEDLYGKLDKIETGAGIVYLGTGTSVTGNFDDYFTMTAKVFKNDKTTEWTAQDVLNPTTDSVTDNSNFAYVQVTVTLKQELSSPITLSGATVSVTWNGMNSVELGA